MTTDEFESLIGGAEETDKLEVKQAMDWAKVSLARDILAMANVQDGGNIVIGIEDETYARQGLTDAQLATYVPDEMRDQISEYADPEVIFSVRKPTDKNGRCYVVIAVSEFEELPVICKRDAQELQKGTIYFRSRTQKPQSARVSNSNDMRRIVERAIAKRGTRLREMGFSAAPVQENAFDTELGEL